MMGLQTINRARFVGCTAIEREDKIAKKKTREN